MHRLVDHDHAGAVVLGVPGRLDRGGDVVADAGQQLGPAVPGADDLGRGFEGMPGLGLAERVELPGVAVRGDDRDPAVDQAPGQRRVGVPVGAAVGVTAVTRAWRSACAVAWVRLMVWFSC
jgi:hypothetical protein